MSFRNTQGARQRSSSVTRNGTSSSPSYSRPRSLGFFGSNSNLFSPYAASSPTKAFSSSYAPGSLSNYNMYSSNYTSPYFPNGYRGAATNGYASLTIPAKALNNFNVMPSYSNSRDFTKSGNVRQSRPTSRAASFNRDRSLSRSQSSLSGSMGGRSVSLTSLNSLNSEGYASGTERSSRGSRLGSTSDIRGENGEIDYKKLYEQSIVENDRLKDKLRKSDEELRDTKQTLERLNTVTSKNSLSELEKREKRAMERKLSEMEEELKQLQKLKAENERLRAENRALTRVVSKLTNSANK